MNPIQSKPPAHPVGQNENVTDYPKMIYRDGDMETLHGVKVDWMIVDNEDEEVEALSDGWRATPRSDGASRVVSAKDAEIAALKAQIEAMSKPAEAEAKRGPGRPPKAETLTLAKEDDI